MEEFTIYVDKDEKENVHPQTYEFSSAKKKKRTNKSTRAPLGTLLDNTTWNNKSEKVNKLKPKSKCDSANLSTRLMR